MWQHLDTIAQIVSAFGTLAAVIVALYLARHQNAPRLRVTASRAHLVAQGTGLPPEDVLRIAIANAGYRDVMVEGLGWQIGLFRKAYFYQTLSSHPLGGKLPAKLTPSERVSYTFSWDDFLPKSEDMRRRFGRFALSRRVRARTMRVNVSLSTGENLSFPIAGELRRALLQASINSHVG